MSIGFVIVTYNSGHVLRECLASIPATCETVVIDNASSDGSAGLARSLGARVWVSEKNIGFGAACNRGAALLATTHVFFLNPDAVLTPGAVPEIERAISLYPEAGGYGPAIEAPGKRRKFRSTSYPQCQADKKEVAPAGDADVDFLDGAALVCGREYFIETGGFDERIFLYYEDDDLCYRIRRSGKKLVYVGASVVYHKRNESSRGGMGLDYFRSFHAAKSRIFMCEKYGLPLDSARERRQAALHLLKAILSLNRKKAAKSLGALRAFHNNGIKRRQDAAHQQA
jgi:N-acetylglucosaminyl-diphospho-decaprenol L-rhamnosyltransferase